MPVILEIPRLSCWHHSLSLSFSLMERHRSSMARAAIQSRGKGLSTFKKSPIHFCNHRAYDQHGAKRTADPAGRAKLVRVVIFYSPATISNRSELQILARKFQVARILTIATMTKSLTKAMSHISDSLIYNCYTIYFSRVLLCRLRIYYNYNISNGELSYLKHFVKNKN